MEEAPVSKLGPGVGFRVWGFGAWGLGLTVRGSGCLGLGSRVFQVWGLLAGANRCYCAGY